MPIPDEFIYSQTSDEDGSFNFFQDKDQEDMIHIEESFSTADDIPILYHETDNKGESTIFSAFALWMTTRVSFLKEWFRGF